MGFYSSFYLKLSVIKWGIQLKTDLLGGKHEANIRGGEKLFTFFFEYLSRSLL